MDLRQFGVHNQFKILKQEGLREVKRCVFYQIKCEKEENCLLDMTAARTHVAISTSSSQLKENRWWTDILEGWIIQKTLSDQLFMYFGTSTLFGIKL